MPMGVYQRKYVPVIDRILKKINKSEGGCWLFVGGRIDDGYGRITFSGRGPKVLVHRYIYWYYNKQKIFTWWEFDKNSRINKLEICHRCDNPPCCNPEHLFEETHKGNMADASQKGRWLNNSGMKGVNHPLCKLTENQVLEIYRASGLCKNIAPKYGITFQQVWRIKHGENWGHITQNV